MRKAMPGQPMGAGRAADRNLLLNAADVATRSRLNIDGNERKARQLDLNRVMIRNDSGTNLRRGDVVALTRTLLVTDVSIEKPWFSAEGLTTSNRSARMAALIDPVNDGEIGPARIVGVCEVFVNVIATWHRKAFPHGEATLRSGIFGPVEILSEPENTGEQFLLCTIGHADNRGLFCKTTSAISAGSLTSGRLTLGSGTAVLCDPYSTLGQYEDTEHEVTCYNMAGGEVATGGYGFLTPTDDWLPLFNIDPCTQPVEAV